MLTDGIERDNDSGGKTDPDGVDDDEPPPLVDDDSQSDVSSLQVFDQPSTCVDAARQEQARICAGSHSALHYCSLSCERGSIPYLEVVRHRAQVAEAASGSTEQVFWENNWLRRNSLSYRKKTNKKTKSTEERLPKIKRWHARLRLRLQTPQEGETVDPVWGVWLPNDRYNVDQAYYDDAMCAEWAVSDFNSQVEHVRRKVVFCDNLSGQTTEAWVAGLKESNTDSHLLPTDVTDELQVVDQAEDANIEIPATKRRCGVGSEIVPTEHVNHAEEHQVVAAGGLFMPKTLTSVALVTDEEATAVAMAVAEDAAIAEVENEDAEREEESSEEEDEEVFIVEKLGAIKWINGVRHFWVKWKTYDSSYNSWEPETGLPHKMVVKRLRK
ncbi:hypothetical protein CYMTET_25631 [Cymbomonas tetramitiformis]|uniref:Chromo domain-containing protein n=1 Tax=Cymbomonas tetramitiformis TaxID=36881 RepID=A0AAE0FTU7_9CHLO|nr:hypothetical protein CYMTET_25631 [Cymbomonas tetramitiformis]